MTSPYLTKTYGAGLGFGLSGAPVDDPTRSISLITNKNLGYGHFVALGSTPAAATPLYYVVDVSFWVNFGGTTGTINMKPNFIAYYPKDISVPYESDTNPSNYYALVALDAPVAQAGIAVIDLADVAALLKKAGYGSGKAQSAPVLLNVTSSQILTCGPGGGSSSRVIERGGDYVMTSVYSAVTASVVDSVCVYNLRNRTAVTTKLSAGKNAAKVLYVGNGAQLPLGSPTPITVIMYQTLTGITAANFLANANALLAYRTAIATATGVSVTSVTTKAARRRTLLAADSAAVTTTVTTSNPSVTTASLANALTSPATATALQTALVCLIDAALPLFESAYFECSASAGSFRY